MAKFAYDDIEPVVSIRKDVNAYKISKEQLYVSELNDGYDMSGAEELAEEMKRTGFTSPISVYKMPDGRFKIYSGAVRFKAWCEILGNDTISCHVHECPDDPLEEFEQHLKANTLHRDVDDIFYSVAEANAEKQLRAAGYGIVGKDIEAEHQLTSNDFYARVGEMIGKSVRTVHRYRQYQQLSPELKELMSMNMAMSTVLLAADRPENEQRIFIAECRAMYERDPETVISREVAGIILSKAKSSAKPAKRKTYAESFSSSQTGFVKTMYQSTIRPGDDVADTLEIIHTISGNYLKQVNKKGKPATEDVREQAILIAKAYKEEFDKIITELEKSDE